ncbi:protein-glutamine glutaminase family protein [Crossiella sp. CA198]|uniref:protein-glutamine glutaminase family protein n=1 Tax=Crossiella sp. CA198 TaxID=3455607 RepID=UPI003F8D7D21
MVDTLVDPPAAMTAAAESAGNYLDIAFSSGRAARVDLRDPRARGWVGAFTELRAAGLDVYVELDPDTGLVTEVLVPHQVAVIALSPGEDLVEVDLEPSQAHHYLRRDNPDFAELLALLEAARDSQHTVLVTETLDKHAIIDVRPAPKEAVAEQLTEGVPAALGTPVSYAQVVQMYRLVAGQTACSANPTAPGIPFTYPDDGCWGRAHEMARLMIANGITPDKVWIRGSLRVNSANKPDCVVGWGWHVAPTLVAGGVTYVIDPALFDGPVTQDTWKGVQGDPAARLEPTGWDIFHNFYAPHRVDPDYRLTNEVLARYRAELQLRSNSASGPPPYAHCQPAAPGVQFRGSLAGGQTARWFTHSWNAAQHVIWHLMPVTPVTGGPELDWDVAVERTSAALCTYWITVRNLTGIPVTFEGRYAILNA